MLFIHDLLSELGYFMQTIRRNRQDALKPNSARAQAFITRAGAGARAKLYVMRSQAYMMRFLRGLKGVRSCPGILRARRSKFSASVGNCLEAAKPVPSMPGTYSSRGSSVALSASVPGR